MMTKIEPFNIFMTLLDLLHLQVTKHEKIIFFNISFAFIKFIVYLQS